MPNQGGNRRHDARPHDRSKPSLCWMTSRSGLKFRDPASPPNRALVKSSATLPNIWAAQSCSSMTVLSRWTATLSSAPFAPLPSTGKTHCSRVMTKVANLGPHYVSYRDLQAERRRAIRLPQGNTRSHRRWLSIHPH
jgi:hypothetical protein